MINFTRFLEVIFIWFIQKFHQIGTEILGASIVVKKTLKKLQAIYPFANFYFTFTAVNPADSNHTLLFVYGTLKRDYSNHALLAAAHFVGEAATIEEYGFYLGPDEHAPEEPGIPFLSAKPKVGDAAVQVRGELWQVDSSTLAQLDELEGHPDWYQRKKIAVCLTSEESVSAFTYLLPEAPKGLLQPIISGRF